MSDTDEHRRPELALDVQLLAHTAVAVIGASGAATLKIRNRKTLALLGFLALSDSKQEARDRLVGLLWGNVDMENARHSLRMSLTEIRKVLAPTGFADSLRIGTSQPSITRASGLT